MIVLPVTIVMLLGLPLQTAVWAIVGITMAQFIVYGTQRALVAAPNERRLLLALVAIVAVAAFLALWLPGTNEWWRFRLDSWFHAAVVPRHRAQRTPGNRPVLHPAPTAVHVHLSRVVAHRFGCSRGWDRSAR